jgi:HPt (histidine-containing phosphotransfer) domain-containing protein
MTDANKPGLSESTNAAAFGEPDHTGRLDTEARLEFDLDLLVNRCMNNPAVIEMILDRFAKQAADDLSRLEASILANDSKAVREVAHSLRGAAGIIAAGEVARVALELELMGRRGDLVNAGMALDRLGQLIERCLADIPQARSRLAARKGGAAASGG